MLVGGLAWSEWQIRRPGWAIVRRVLIRMTIGIVESVHWGALRSVDDVSARWTRLVGHVRREHDDTLLVQRELTARGIGVRWVTVVVGAVAEQVTPRRTLRWGRRIGKRVVGVWTVIVIPSHVRLMPMSQEGLTHLRFFHLATTIYEALV